jgi:pyruvate dehydrogenase E1 component alpha subunit
MAPHATADDPTVYIDAERVEAERRNECVGRYERYLRRRGLVDDALVEEVRAAALQRMREGIAEAESFAPAGAERIFDSAYASPPPSLALDQSELQRILAQEGTR